MAFRVYKPRNFVTLKAEQLTNNTIDDLANRLMGRIVHHKVDQLGDHQTALQVPTFDGPIVFLLGDYIIRNDDNTLSKMSAEEFEKTYELARNTVSTK